MGVDFDRGPNSKFEKNSRPVTTVTLHEILQRHSISSIAYFSLDIERDEVKHLRELLSDNELEQIQRMSMWGETLLSSQGVQSQNDMTGLDEFSGNVQYLAEKALTSIRVGVWFPKKIIR